MINLNEIFKKSKPKRLVATTHSEDGGNRVHHYGTFDGRPFLHSIQRSKTPNSSWADYQGVGPEHTDFHLLHKEIKRSLKDNHGFSDGDLKKAGFHRFD
jgi:hypothetical protein